MVAHILSLFLPALEFGPVGRRLVLGGALSAKKAGTQLAAVLGNCQVADCSQRSRCMLCYMLARYSQFIVGMLTGQ